VYFRSQKCDIIYIILYNCYQFKSSPCVLYPISSTREHNLYLCNYIADTAKYLEIFGSFTFKIEGTGTTCIPNVCLNEIDNLADLAVDVFIILGLC